MLAVTTIFLLGFDSLVAAAALGPLAHRRSRWILVGLFGGCDGLATLVGEMGLFRLPHLAVGLVPVALACYGVYLMAVSAWARRLGRIGMFITPVLLSLDNLVAGQADSAGLSIQQVPLVTVVSCLLALVGLLLGANVAARTDMSRNRLAGIGLLLAAVAIAH
ncbi:MAG: hypothetical protein ACXV3F_01895 [Frankiaceae bacterium]